MKKNTFRWLLLWGCWGSFLALGLLRGGASSWFLCYAFGVMMLYCAGVALFSLGGLRAERTLSDHRLVAGDGLTVSVTLRRRRSALPLPWLLVQEEWMLFGGGAGHTFRKLFFPWFRTTLVYRYRLTGLPRGEFRLVCSTVTTGDLFGLISRTKELPGSGKEASVLVYPRPVSIRNGMLASDDGEGRRFVTWSSSSSFSGVRDYVYGDPLNRIHWKSSAKADGWKTKEPEPGGSVKTMLLLDTSSGSFGVETGSFLLEKGIQAAAGLIRLSAEKGWELGFACCHTDAAKWRVSGSADLPYLFELLAKLNSRGTLLYSDLVEKESLSASADALLICITPKLDEALLRSVRGALQRKRAVQLWFVHAFSVLPPPEAGRIKLMKELGCSVIELPARGMLPLPAAGSQGGVVDVSA